AIKWLQENYSGKHRAIGLKVSAPFHCKLMKPAEKRLAKYFEELTFSPNQLPYIANVDAKLYPSGSSGEVICQNLIDQVCASVLWNQSLSSLDDSTKFIEVGPGSVLKGLNKKINTNFQTYELDNDNGFE